MIDLVEIKKRQEIQAKVINIILENSEDDQEYFLNLLSVLEKISNALSTFRDIEIK